MMLISIFIFIVWFLADWISSYLCRYLISMRTILSERGSRGISSHEIYNELTFFTYSSRHHVNSPSISSNVNMCWKIDYPHHNLYEIIVTYFKYRFSSINAKKKHSLPSDKHGSQDSVLSRFNNYSTLSISQKIWGLMISHTSKKS